MEFLYWIYEPGVLFCSFVCSFISLYTYAARYPNKNDSIIFRKSSFYLVVL